MLKDSLRILLNIFVFKYAKQEYFNKKNDFCYLVSKLRSYE